MSFDQSSHSNRQAARSGLSRRAFLTRVGIAAAGTLLLPSTEAFAKSLTRERLLTLHNMHTDEELSIVCCPQQHYDRKLLNRFSYFLRDHYTDEAHPMDPALIDLLYAVSVLTRSRGEYKIISGYRAPETNQRLRKLSHGVAEHSLHMEGKAIDLRMDDVSTRTIQQTALALEQGGVGYYRTADFVHLDTGAVRSW
ncbi:MAG TPA: DUF882 domain-containing protein [Methylococcaceae bacterium]|jgi:uncharacterized protein YcbK (DUF882 family)|nr:DUF882 domain-containing protein [Methylococcaceae bacterium]